MAGSLRVAAGVARGGELLGVLVEDEGEHFVIAQVASLFCLQLPLGLLRWSNARRENVTCRVTVGSPLLARVGLLLGLTFVITWFPSWLVSGGAKRPPRVRRRLVQKQGMRHADA